MAPLTFLERPTAGEGEGLLVLHHGRGMDEKALLGVAGALDPVGRLRVVAPRGPLVVAGEHGYQWYRLGPPGHPDPETFQRAQSALTGFYDELWRRTGVGPERTVLAGFSMGAAMSYAMALGSGRPHVAGVIAFGGRIPAADGWEPAFAEHRKTSVLIVHGREDPTVCVGHARAARDLLEAAGLTVEYHESAGGHRIDRATLPHVGSWLANTLELEQPST
jgi:phospholipase/carboxylesterase